jgi:hypothetical protein
MNITNIVKYIPKYGIIKYIPKYGIMVLLSDYYGFLSQVTWYVYSDLTLVSSLSSRGTGILLRFPLSGHVVLSSYSGFLSLRSHGTLILLWFPLSQVTWYSHPTPVSSLSSHEVLSSYSGYSKHIIVILLIPYTSK